MKIDPPRRPRGRPCCFDKEVALRSAMKVFWKKGFEAASVDDLAEAMKITPPSIYASYGNKESLFLRVLEYYCAGPGKFVLDALAEPTARAVAEKFLFGAIARMDPECPGCLVNQTATLLADEQTAIGKKILEICENTQRAYADRFKRARAEGDLPPSADPDALARYLRTVAAGMSIQAAAGATLRELKAVVETALSQWPQSPKRSRRAKPSLPVAVRSAARRRAP